MNSLSSHGAIIPVVEFPSSVRSLFHPGISHCSLKTREQFQKMNEIGVSELKKAMGPGGQYEGQPIDVVGRIVCKKYQPTCNYNDDEGYHRCEPYGMDQLTYHEACDYVEKSWIRYPLSSMNPETFHHMLKMIHQYILDPSHPNLKGFKLGEYRTCGDLVVNKNPAHLDIPLADILRQEKEKVKGTPQEQEVNKQLKTIHDLMQLAAKDPDLTFYDVSRQKRGTTPEQSALYNKYYVVFPSGKNVPLLMDEFVKNLQQDLRDKKDVIAMASKAHLEFVRIHPFVEGNGRMARMLMNMILMQGGHQPIAFATDKAYTDAIRADDAGNEGAFERYIRSLVYQFDYEALPIELLSFIHKIERILKCFKTTDDSIKEDVSDFKSQ